MPTPKEEERNVRFGVFIDKLSKIGVPTDKLVEMLGDNIKGGSFSVNTDLGLAYPGSLVWVSLFQIANYAFKINSLYPVEFQVPADKLLKVALLQHISKAIRIIPNPSQREVERGKPYAYDSTQPALKFGIHSYYLAMEAGIHFTADEVEAMTIIDRDDNDAMAKWHCSIFASIIRQANDMCYMENMSRQKMGR